MFSKLARWTGRAVGHPYTFTLGLTVIVIWAARGPVFDFSDTWQLVINTGTTIATFLVVFLVQNTQNRDATAMHLKLDELIRAVDGAHNALLDTEEISQPELDRIRKRYENLAADARAHLSLLYEQGTPDIDPDAQSASTPRQNPGT